MMENFPSSLTEGFDICVKAVIDVLKPENFTDLSENSELHAEIRLKPKISKCDAHKFLEEIREALLCMQNVPNGQSFNLPVDIKNKFSETIDQIIVTGASNVPQGQQLKLTETTLPSSNLHLYQLSNREAEIMELLIDESKSDCSTAVSLLWELPAREFDGIWENLIFDDCIKDELLSYVIALTKLSKKNVNSSILRVNRMILLHGSPGTGKTSLCKALAQKLSIRFSHDYRRICLVEVNSHSLFSKFFSESGKLIQCLFSRIEEIAEDPKVFVFILIDEARILQVESLTIARGTLLSQNEPTDALRAVNAVLTQIDRMRRRSNVFIFTTSNLVQSLDEAFTDRTDLCRLVGNPSVNAIYTIFRSCIQEMQRVGIVESGLWFDKRSGGNQHCAKLMQLSRKAYGLSGRCLRQLPVIGYSKLPLEKLSINQCLELLQKALEEKIMGKKESVMRN